jgi:hypothetical protein
VKGGPVFPNFFSSKSHNMKELPLDAPIKESGPQRPNLAHRIFFGLELLLWAVALLALLFTYESWEGGSELLVLSVGFLIFAYLLFPILLFGSRGWRQHIGSHLTGNVMALVVSAFLFRSLHWEGAREMALLAFMPSLLFLLTVIIIILAKPLRWHKSHFYKHIMVRAVLAAMLTIFVVFIH